jgi:hypothetical protein
MADHDGPRLPGVPRVKYPPRVDPTEGLDWTNEPFHQAMVKQPLYRTTKAFSIGPSAIVFVFVIAIVTYAIYEFAQWWTAA